MKPGANDRIRWRGRPNLSQLNKALIDRLLKTDLTLLLLAALISCILSWPGITEASDQWTSIQVESAAISSIAVDPSDSSTVYVSTYGNGIWKSTDSGQTWNSINNGLTTLSVSRLAVYPLDSSIIYASIDNAMWKSKDAGNTWTYKGSSIYIQNPNAMTVDPQISDTVYVGTDGSGVWRSVDGGSTWNFNLSVGGDSVQGISTDQSGAIYAAFCDSTGLWKTSDHGKTWKKISSASTPGLEDCLFRVAIDPSDSNVVYAGAQNGIWKTINGGTSWNMIFDKSPGFYDDIAVHPLNPDVIDALCDGYIYKSIDSGDTWINSGVPNGNYRGMAIDPSGTNIFVETTDGRVFIGKIERPPTYAISGTVNAPSGPLTGVTMSLTGAATQNTTTDANGNYRFIGLSNGVYSVKPTKATYSFNPSSRSVSIQGKDITGQNFTGTSATTSTTSSTTSTTTVPPTTIPTTSSTTTAKTTVPTTTTTTVPPTSGSLKVTLSPGEAVSAGAQWKVDAGSWQASGATVSNLSVGNHSVTFKDIPGWTTPAAKSIAVASGKTATTSGTYVEESVDFAVSPASGKFPLLVKFTDKSTGTVKSRLWEFGDGKTSTAKNPSYTYSKAGTYTVKLTVTRPSGAKQTKTETNCIIVYAPPKADFNANPTSGKVPLEVAFTDKSTGNVANWSWKFGDGGVSSSRNPVYTYKKVGTYTVTLTVKGAGGSNTAAKTKFISVAK